MPSKTEKFQWLGPATLDAIDSAIGYRDGAVAYINGQFVGTIDRIEADSESRHLGVYVRLTRDMAHSLTSANHSMKKRSELPWRFVVENFLYVEGDRGYLTAVGVVKISTSDYDTIVIWVKMLDEDWHQVRNTLKINQILPFDASSLNL